MANHPHNIILISLDGVRADVAYSQKFRAINSICCDGAVFTKAISSAPLTPISHASVLSGLFPYNHGIRHLYIEQMFPEVVILPQILQQHQYSTNAIVSCPGLHSWYGFNRGFDFYDDEIPLVNGQNALNSVDVKTRGYACKKADDVYRRFQAVVEKMNFNSPQFLFLHFFDAHWPYDPPEPYASAFSQNLYEGEIAYIDYYLMKVFDTLKEKKLYDDAIIVVFADHGEDMKGLYQNDHGGEKLGHPEEEGHGMCLFDATLHVPLIIKLPKGMKYQPLINKQVRLVDVVPTLLDLTNIASNIQFFDGVSLLAHLQGNGKNLVGYAETHYPRENPEMLKKFPHLTNLKTVRICENGIEYKIIWHLNNNQVEVYDLSQDKNEKNNLLWPDL